MDYQVLFSPRWFNLTKPVGMASSCTNLALSPSHHDTRKQHLMSTANFELVWNVSSRTKNVSIYLGRLSKRNNTLHRTQGGTNEPPPVSHSLVLRCRKPHALACLATNTFSRRLISQMMLERPASVLSRDTTSLSTIADGECFEPTYIYDCSGCLMPSIFSISTFTFTVYIASKTIRSSKEQ